MANTKYRARVSKRRKNRNWRGLPQMMVVVSAEPEFGGEAISLTWAYRFCKGEGVSAPLERVKQEALRRLKGEELVA